MQCYISFWCTMWWLDISLTCKVIISIILAPTQHYTWLLQYRLNSLCCTLHPCDYDLDNSNTHPTTLHIVTTTLAMFPMLYFTSPWLFYICWFMFNPFTFSPSLPNPLPFGNHQLVLCIYEFVSVLCVCLLCFLGST